MEKMGKTLSGSLQVGEEVNAVQTTLYELIGAINEEVLPEDDWIVTDAVVELFETGRARFLAAT